MPHFCCVIKCAMRSERDNVSFFRFPAALTNRGDHLNALSSERRNAWIKALKRDTFSESQVNNKRICSRHFITGKPALLNDKTNPDWIPSQNMGYVCSILPMACAAPLFQRSTKIPRIDTQVQAEINDFDAGAGTSSQQLDDIPREEITIKIEENCVSQEEITIKVEENRVSQEEITIKVEENCVSQDILQEEITIKMEENCASQSVQTDLTDKYLSDVFKELNLCKSKIYTLETKLQMLDLTEDCFKNDDSKTCYFTGIPKAGLLFIIYDEVSPYLSSQSHLSTFQQFLLTFMKLRLNLPFEYLSYRFAISLSTASECFYKTINVLYEVFKNFVFWPERANLQINVPACFKDSFGDSVTAIIDCLEVSIETPSSVSNASRCRSNYKHETLKFLIGITAQGTISYVSESWGGGTRDNFLVENCGFLDLILPGDVVVADRGFLMKDSVELGVFIMGKNQLSPTDLENVHNIANLRINVGRIIGILRKKFKIFHETIPMSMLCKDRDGCTALDKIVVVCSAFVNLCPPEIPLT